MAIYVEHAGEVLIVPTKTASMTVEHLAGDRVLPRDRVSRTAPATLICRDPVSWYASGYRHCHDRDWIRADKSYRQCATFRFEAHLRQCIMRRDRALLGKLDWITPFDFHSWMNAEYQASGKFYDIDRDQPGTYTGAFPVVQRVQLEDTDSFRRVVQRFTGCEDVAQQRHNVNNNRQLKIDLTPTVISLLRELDDWSHLAGYDFDESVQRAQASINTVCV